MSELSERRALEAYPPTHKVSDGRVKRVQSDKVDTSEGVRTIYRRGYERAEEDLRLTWHDIQDIVRIADMMVNNFEYDKVKSMGEEGYYTEILKRFNKEKYGNTQE